MNNQSTYFYKRMPLKFALIGLSLLFIFCNNNPNKNKTANSKKQINTNTESYPLRYDFKNPVKQIKLPNVLKEISGLSYYENNQLICQHDEKADIFIINYLTGEIAGKQESNKFGDYEGIEHVNGTVYLLKSNGTITEFTQFNITKQQKTTYKTKISQKNDAEGLAYDPKTNSLLIACKSKPSLKDAVNKLKHKRCIYQFSLDKKELIGKPFLCIDLDKMEKDYGKKSFMPSAIAYNSLEDNFYILSAVGNHLLIVDRNSNILHLEKLPPKIYTQPEGICFSPDDNTLFISNEGKIGSSNILVFKRHSAD